MTRSEIIDAMNHAIQMLPDDNEVADLLDEAKDQLEAEWIDAGEFEDEDEFEDEFEDEDEDYDYN